MPLLRKKSDCGSGNSNEKRNSLAEVLAIETGSPDEPTAAQAVHNRNNVPGGGANVWRWEEPSSPQAAQSPGALVPLACFPPRLPNAFTSYTERAQPAEGLWVEEVHSTGGITDLVSSLKALAMPSGSNSSPVAHVDRVGVQRRVNRPLARDRDAVVPRRASYCGVVSNKNTDVVKWSGILPPRYVDHHSGFSTKVFLGGLPWDITEHTLMQTLSHFEPTRVEWPGRECNNGNAAAPRGYAYMTFDNERRVRSLLAASRRDGTDWYYRIGTKKMRNKEVQVIPWALSDSNWVLGGSVRLEPARTVFVGALHGMMSASALATIMNDLFAGVVYAGIDTDKHKYPIGSGRVTFNNVHSYVRAISAAYVEIHTDKFKKKVQVNPYLEDSMCSLCNLQQGPYFCREPTCFGYFCRSCWSWQHSDTLWHKPLTRNSNRHSHHELALEPASGFNNAISRTNEGTPSPPTSGSSDSALSTHSITWHH